MTNTRNQEIDSTLKEHGKAISNLQETLAAMLKQQEQSMKQQEEILRALKEHSSVALLAAAEAASAAAKAALIKGCLAMIRGRVLGRQKT
ncbi:hypothetical protein HanIR_Chr07g0317221 [Helianthus annuus]|nr:hypothetical protein HanIR_Chr07g0317221 [Helianthus annuus]